MIRRSWGLATCLFAAALLITGVWALPARPTRANDQTNHPILVPDDYPTIQAAIDASSSGDTIVVAPGIYEENISFLTKNITVTSETGPEATIIDGGAEAESVVIIGPGGKLIGFKIRSGYGIGGGASVSGSGSVLLGNIFEGNQQAGGYYGAAIAGNGASPIIEGNLFIGNACDNQFLSGVVSFVNNSSPQIFNNIFKDNPCRAINFTLPTGNSPKVFNNTIVNNTVGIRVDARVNTGAQIFRNNLIFGNGIGLEVDFGSPPNEPTWEYNLVFGNNVDYDGIPDLTGQDGNLSAPPLFEDLQGGNYELGAGSPAIDAGTSVSCPLFDIRNLARPQGTACDMGAYETVLAAHKSLAGITMAGEVVTYSISITNLIDSDLTGVVVTDIVPDGLDYIPGSYSASFGTGGEEEGVISWSGTIPTDTALSMGFSATIDPETPERTLITNTVEIEWQGLTFSREATMTIEPYRAYLPNILRSCPPVFFDDFSSVSSGWPVVDDGDILLEYRDGEYRILVRPSFGGAISRPGFQATNYTVGVDLRNPGSISGSYGIAFGIAGDWSTFYSLEIYDSGWFGIYRWGPGGITTLVENFSPAIRQGNDANRIAIERNGSGIKAYANGSLLASLTDGTYQGSRYIGLIAISYGQPGLDVRFDNFTVTPIVCGSDEPNTEAADTWSPSPPPDYFMIDPADLDFQSQER